jgi:hypothetical protein
MNSPLGNRLLARMKAGETLDVRHATADDLLGFAAERWDCHNNVRRWCEEHPGDHRVMGWIISGGCVLDRHSVVDRGPKGLLDITPGSAPPVDWSSHWVNFIVSRAFHCCSRSSKTICAEKMQ